MGHQCKYCKKEKTPLERYRVLFSFPKEPTLKSQWCTIMGLDESKISATSRLCSDHFESRHFKISGSKTLLKPNAIPTTKRIPPCITNPGDFLESDKNNISEARYVRHSYTRQDFVSDSVYKEFLQYKKVKDIRLRNLKLKLWRSEKKIKTLEGRIATLLKDAESEYL